MELIPTRKKNQEVVTHLPDNLVGEISTRWATGWLGGIRTGFRNFRRTFWPTTPSYAGTKVSYTTTRQLYRSDDKNSNLGSGMVRRIVNSRVDFIELPFVATGDEVIDEFLQKGIDTYWSSDLQQMIRDATRDAETVVRIKRYNQDNPLISAEQWEICYLESVPIERTSIYYLQNGDRNEIERAYIRHEIEEVVEEASSNGRAMTLPKTRQKVIIEEITPDAFRYWDETEGEWRKELEQPNSWGFVPLVEVKNEEEAYLEGGQSDLEACLPFVLAFHDVMAAALTAHKAHSIPKAKFKINDLMGFIANNWPESFEKDEQGRIKPETFNGNIKWKGTEILFMQSEEDAEFLEARSVLGDSKTLMDFLLDCIAMTSETPRFILMATKVDDTDEIVPFTKLINRKRNYFKPFIQEICKMVLAINHMEPVVVPLAWDEITPQQALDKAQALQQRVMADEVLATREVISDRTMRADLKRHLPHMKSDSQEKADARSNKQLEITSPGSVSGTDSGRNE